MDGFNRVLLNTHEQYLELLAKIEKRAVYVEIVQICVQKSPDQIIEFAKEHLQLIDKKSVYKWFGTISHNTAPKYIFVLTKSFWDFLRQFSSFFFNGSNECPWDIINTAFGMDDIAFLDEKYQPLFYTTTHEGDAYLLQGLDI